jgi:hypothetical protein
MDHSVEDVVKKLNDQKPFLPDELAEKTAQFLKSGHRQETLNELFHLLKKYDLADEEERLERNEKLAGLVGG